MKHLPVQIVTFLACLALSTTARATLIAYDGFEGYTAGAALNTGASGTGWSANWTSLSTVNVVEPASAINYANGAVSVSGGTRAVEVTTLAITDNVASRSFAAQTGTLYFSFLFRVESGAGSDDFIQFALNNDTAIDNSGSIGDLNTTSGVNFFSTRIGGISGGGTTTNSSTSLANATTFFLVGKISKVASGNYNVMTLFLNPSTATETSASATQTTDSNISSLSYFTVRVANLESTDQYRFDELRIGTTWADVVPVPEPAACAALAGGLVLMAAAFRRRR